MQLAVLDDVRWIPVAHRVTVESCDQLPDLAVYAVNVVVSCGRQVLLVDVVTRGWSLPGGHLEPVETPLDAARRELAEETGLVCDDLSIVGTWRIALLSDPPPDHPYPIMSQIAIAACRLAEPTLPTLPVTSEVAATAWYSRDELTRHPDASLLLPLVSWWLASPPTTRS